MNIKKSTQKKLFFFALLLSGSLACSISDLQVPTIAPTETPTAIVLTEEPEAPVPPTEAPTPEPTALLFETKLLETKELEIPDAWNYFPVYLADGRLLVFTDFGAQSAHPSFEYIYYFESWVEDAEFIQILLPNDENCPNGTSYSIVGRIPDGRVGLVKYCLQAPELPAFLFAINWETRAFELYGDVPLPYGQTTSYSWNPDMNAGIAEVSDLINGTVHWFSLDDTSPLSIILSDGETEWSLEDTYNDLFDPNAEYGIVENPSWSPDGGQIAFTVSVEALQANGLARIDAARQLVLINPETETFSVVLDDLYRVSELVWSADGNWLLFNAQFGKDGPEGVWLYSLVSGELTLVYEADNIQELDWSPDMKEVVVVECTQAGDCLEPLEYLKVILLDVSAIVE